MCAPTGGVGACACSPPGGQGETLASLAPSAPLRAHLCPSCGHGDMCPYRWRRCVRLLPAGGPGGDLSVLGPLCAFACASLPFVWVRRYVPLQVASVRAPAPRRGGQGETLVSLAPSAPLRAHLCPSCGHGDMCPYRWRRCVRLLPAGGPGGDLSVLGPLCAFACASLPFVWARRYVPLQVASVRAPAPRRGARGRPCIRMVRYAILSSLSHPPGVGYGTPKGATYGS